MKSHSGFRLGAIGLDAHTKAALHRQRFAAYWKEGSTLSAGSHPQTVAGIEMEPTKETLNYQNHSVCRLPAIVVHRALQ